MVSNISLHTNAKNNEIHGSKSHEKSIILVAYDDLCAHNSVHNGLFYEWEDMVVFRADGYEDVILPN